MLLFVFLIKTATAFRNPMIFCVGFDFFFLHKFLTLKVCVFQKCFLTFLHIFIVTIGILLIQFVVVVVVVIVVVVSLLLLLF